MRRQYRYDDDFDETGVLRDGHTARVRMMLRDGGRAVDGNQYRPGFRTGDADMRDARQKANDEYEHELTNAWRDAGRKITQRDPQGRLMSTLEEEEEDVTDAKPPMRDGRTLDQVRHDHQRNMANIYQAYEQSLVNAWRMKP